MAKRYFSFEDLKEYGLGSFKPGSTLGSHHAIIESISDDIVVVSGSSKGRVEIRQDWTLGYNCGEAWAIKPAHLISDPLLRVLRELRISKESLEISSSEIHVFCEHKICGAGYGLSGTTIKTLGEGWKRRYQGRPPEWYPNSDIPHPDEGEYYADGEAAIIYSHRCDRNFGQTRTNVEKVVVRPNVSREFAAELIRRKLIEEPAQKIEARKNEEAEKQRKISKAEQEFNDFIQNEDWMSIAAPLLANIVLHERAKSIMYPYTMNSLPDNLFPIPNHGRDGTVLWSNGTIKITLESYTFAQIAVQHRDVTQYRNNDPLSHLFKPLNAFQISFSLPKCDGAKTLNEKNHKLAELSSLKNDLIAYLIKEEKID